jgi:tRNA dimethylallyltransferase
VKVVFVVGSTASGKSAYALKKAQETKGAIINCDSIQLYQGLKIGSALPTEEEMANVPHFLFSYVPKGQRMTAGQYARDFYALMAKIEDQFEVAYVVGGTGFYFQAIEKGLFDVQRPNQELRAAIEKEMETPEGAKKIYQEMIFSDPKSAEKIHEHDHYRIARSV